MYRSLLFSIGLCTVLFVTVLRYDYNKVCLSVCLAGNLSSFFEKKLQMLCNELVKESPTTYLNHLGMGSRLVLFPFALPGY